MLLLEIDIAPPFVENSTVNADTQRSAVSVCHPIHKEGRIESLQVGWSERRLELGWQDVKTALQKVNSSNRFNPYDLKAIGIPYQMQKLALMTKNQHTTGYVYRRLDGRIAYCFRHGLYITRENDIKTTKAKAGKVNMVLNRTFT